MNYSVPSDFNKLQVFIDEAGDDAFTDRSRFRVLRMEIQELVKERDGHFATIEKMLQTGRIRTLDGSNTLVRATPAGAHLIIDLSGEKPSAVGLFDDLYDADTWAEKNLNHDKWARVALRPTH